MCSNHLSFLKVVVNLDFEGKYNNNLFYAQQLYRCIIANQVLQNNEQKLDPVFVSLKLINNQVFVSLNF